MIPSHIAPDLAPESVVLRFYAPETGRLLAEQRLPPGPVFGYVEVHQRPGEGPPLVVVYDGDDGGARALGICIDATLARVLDGLIGWRPDAN